MQLITQVQAMLGAQEAAKRQCTDGQEQQPPAQHNFGGMQQQQQDNHM